MFTLKNIPMINSSIGESTLRTGSAVSSPIDVIELFVCHLSSKIPYIQDKMNERILHACLLNTPLNLLCDKY